jgi:ribose 5-phosphate isomerase A
LGTKWPVPIEVTPFGWESQIGFLKSIGGKPERRLLADGSPYLTDQGSYILDTRFSPIEDPVSLAQTLKMHTGIVEHGLFIDLADDLVVADQNGITHKKK